MRDLFPAVVAGLTLGTACIRQSSPAGISPIGARDSGTDAARAGTMQARSLVGIWRVVRFCDVDLAGRETQPFGPHPTGYFIYAPSGALSIQVMRMPAMPRFTRDTAPTDTELRTLHESYFGYFGTYTITSDSTVTHHVMGGTLPEYNGTEQPRPYWIWGAHQDSLSIGSARGRACRLLVRVV